MGKFDLYPREEANTKLGQVLSPTPFWLWSLVVLGSKFMLALVMKWDLFPFSFATALKVHLEGGVNRCTANL